MWNSRIDTCVILAAGMGTRMGSNFPKCLTLLECGMSILDHQIEYVRKVFGTDLRILVVVGFKGNLIKEKYPDLEFVENEEFETTNTAYSLSLALNELIPSNVLWMNGDLYFEPSILKHIESSSKLSSEIIYSPGLADEEAMKIEIDKEGFVSKISKKLQESAGEAIGLNILSKELFLDFKEKLGLTSKGDYFEYAIDTYFRSKFFARSTSEMFAKEIDFETDLLAVNQKLMELGHRRDSHAI